LIDVAARETSGFKLETEFSSLNRKRQPMDINKPSMGEGTARFWTAVFGGITAVGLVAAGVYTLFQYIDSKEKDRESRDKDRTALQLQIATTSFAAKQAFNSKHLELCAQATGDAGTIGTSKDKGQLRLARDDFWRLYWGPLGIVEESQVARAMVDFGACLDGKRCDGQLTSLALNLAHACRAEVSNDFQLDLPRVPNRPSAARLNVDPYGNVTQVK
jgi:hypothetical protein